MSLRAKNCCPPSPSSQSILDLKFGNEIPLRYDVELDAVGSARQRCTLNNQNEKNQIREDRREIGHLVQTESCLPHDEIQLTFPDDFTPRMIQQATMIHETNSDSIGYS